MLEQKCQVPIHKGDQQAHVFDHVCTPRFQSVYSDSFLTWTCRQVQDLEKQLSHTRKQLHQLRSMAKEEDSMEHSTLSHSERRRLHIETSQRKKTKPLVKQDLSRVRTSLRKVGMGVFKAPYPHNQYGFGQGPSIPGLPGLPPRGVADELLAQYHATFHVTLPLIHWPSFIQQYEAVYREGSLHTVQRIWGALFFGVLGCGSLTRGLQDGQYYLDAAKGLVDAWDEDISIDHARCALLISIILVETNLKSAGWVWLGIAVRMGQDIGLHYESPTWPSVEDEMRRRVWWSIYACDRSVFSRPANSTAADSD